MHKPAKSPKKKQGINIHTYKQLVEYVIEAWNPNLVSLIDHVEKGGNKIVLLDFTPRYERENIHIYTRIHIIIRKRRAPNAKIAFSVVYLQPTT